MKGSARTYLRGLAHALKPTVQIGREGLTEPLLRSIELAFENAELVKVQFVGSKDRKKEIAAAIDRRLGTECVGLIGHIAIVYRRHPDPERRRIVLPGSDEMVER